MNDRPKLVLQWAREMFGLIALDRVERAARLVEEALELGQAQGLDLITAKRIAERVYTRPAGSAAKEIGQVVMTLEALAENLGISAEVEAQREFIRVSSISRDEWQRRHNLKAEIGIASPCGDVPSLSAAERQERT